MKNKCQKFLKDANHLFPITYKNWLNFTCPNTVHFVRTVGVQKNPGDFGIPRVYSFLNQNSYFAAANLLLTSSQLARFQKEAT